MKNGIRIFLVCFVLVGGTAFFAYWSLNQSNKTLDVLSDSYRAIANIPQIPLPKTTTEQAPTPPPEITVTPTPTETIPSSIDAQVPATPPEVIPTTAEPADLNLSFVFPKKGSEIYIDCTYQFSFQSAAAIGSLLAVLVDAGARETIDPFESGLARQNTVEPNSRVLDWNVGPVWPGNYYIKVTDRNGVVLRSDVFKVRKMSNSLRADEREKICEESDGSSLRSG